MKRILLLSTALLMGFYMQVMAQERAVTGKVTSAEDGSPIPGVSVVLKGTGTGTVTDIDGNYRVGVPAEGGVLQFSFVGLVTQEIQVGARSVLDVAMASDVRQLSEVVVTAVGIEREKKALGYSIENVEGEKVQQISEPDPLRALQGKVAGVNIIGSSGVPGSATRITIRGNSSFLGNNQPLFVVDGIPYNNNELETSNQLAGGGAYSSRIADLDPNNIASMTVLKGGAAAALYGVRAANGVVLITTKTGSTRPSRKGLEVTYSTSYSREEIANLPHYQNSYGTGTGFAYGEVNGSWGAPFPGKVTYPTRSTIPLWQDIAAAYPDADPTVPYRAYPNNVKDFFETGHVFENSISVASGGDRTSFSAVVSRTSQDGFIPNSKFDRTSFSLGGTSILENGLNIGGNFTYSKTNQIGPAGGANNAVGNSSAFSRTLFLGRNWDLQGQPFEHPVTRRSIFFVDRTQSTNPYWSAIYDGFETNVDRFTSNISASYDLTEWLTASYKLGVNSYTQKNQEWFRKGSRGADGLGQIIDDYLTFTEIESNFLLTATKDLNENFSLRAILGHNVNQRTTDNQSYLGTEMVDFEIIDIDNFNNIVPNGGNWSRRRLFGVFGDVTMGYRDYVFLTLTGRNDWSSTLPESNRSFFYPAASASFVFSDALNLSGNILSSGKIRASWSKVGNDADPYRLVPIYQINLGENSGLIGSLRNNDFPFRGIPSATLSNTERDPDLTPEFTTEIELGTQLDFFNGRVGLDLAVYDRRTTDQIALQSIPTASGFNFFQTNFGEMSNKGIEIGLDLTPVRLANGFQWNLYGTFTHNKNVVVSLTDGVEELTIRNLFGGGITPVLRPGEEYGIMRGSMAARDSEGNLLINPANGQLIRAADPGIVGNPNPDFIAGLTNTFSYKGFRVSAVVDYRHGGDLYSVTTLSLLGRGVTQDTERREMNYVIPGYLGDPDTGEPMRDGEGNKIPNTIQVEMNDLYFGETFGINTADEWNVFDATVFRIREVSVAYDIPKSLLEKTRVIGSAVISLTGRNLWYKAPNFPKYTKFDPESNTFGGSNAQGFEFTNAPSVRRYGVNLRLTF